MLTAEQYKRISFRADHTDIGLICRDGTLEVDTEALTKATAEFLSALPGKAEREAEWLKQNQINAVLCDMPLWSIEACELAGVPLLYAGNFTWTELYREFLPERIWQTYAGCYAKIKHSVLYALHNNEMLEFLKNSELSEVSVTARPFDEMSVAEIRSRHRRPIVFVADYVAAADYVITKAGWTTVSECLLARKPMALFSRDGVLEDRTTIKQLEEKHLAVPVTQDELHNIMDIIEKLDMLDGSYSGFYDCADEVAERLISL